MFEIKEYREEMKPALFALTDRCFSQCGKVFEPSGRHSFYNDIARNFVQFWCLFDSGVMIGTVGLKELSEGLHDVSDQLCGVLFSAYRHNGLFPLYFRWHHRY